MKLPKMYTIWLNLFYQHADHLFRMNRKLWSLWGIQLTKGPEERDKEQVREFINKYGYTALGMK